MHIDHLLQTLSDCRNGELIYNNRDELFCFLYENTWYPLRAVINHASGLAGEATAYTKDQALGKLLELLPYVRVEQITVRNNTLTHLSNEEKLAEIAVLSSMIKRLAEC